MRNWGVLIGLMGAMLIYGAFGTRVRVLALVIAGASKLVFIALVLVLGRQYLANARVAVSVDLVMVSLYVAYLVHLRRLVQRPATTA